MFPEDIKSFVVEETSTGTVGLHYHMLIINPDVKKYNRNYINSNIQKIRLASELPSEKGKVRILTWDDNPTYFCKGYQQTIGNKMELIPPVIIYNSLLTLEDVHQFQRKHYAESSAKDKVSSRSKGSVYHTLVDRVRDKDMCREAIVDELSLIYRECCYNSCIPNVKICAGYVFSAMVATQTTVQGTGTDDFKSRLMSETRPFRTYFDPND